ncbi:MAG: dihydropteroate synthase [Pseudomonadota bacterium]
MKSFKLMGILNITPDSFFDGGRFFDRSKAVDHALQMERDGAYIIDIGGESTRPGSSPVSNDEEIERCIPVIEEIRKHSSVKISIDTQKSEVALSAICAGANMINDVSGGRTDPKILNVAAEHDVEICLMHMRGTPKSMQANTHYDNLIDEIEEYFKERIECAKKNGIKTDKIILDPGIGFGKDAKDNIKLLDGIPIWLKNKAPLLIGLSNKSFINNLLGHQLEERLEATLATIGLAYRNGATIFRVHDVASTRRFLEMESKLTSFT